MNNWLAIYNVIKVQNVIMIMLSDKHINVDTIGSA